MKLATRQWIFEYFKKNNTEPHDSYISLINQNTINNFYIITLLLKKRSQSIKNDTINFLASIKDFHGPFFLIILETLYAGINPGSILPEYIHKSIEYSDQMNLTKTLLDAVKLLSEKKLLDQTNYNTLLNQTDIYVLLKAPCLYIWYHKYLDRNVNENGLRWLFQAVGLRSKPKFTIGQLINELGLNFFKNYNIKNLDNLDNLDNLEKFLDKLYLLIPDLTKTSLSLAKFFRISQCYPFGGSREYNYLDDCERFVIIASLMSLANPNNFPCYSLTEIFNLKAPFYLISSLLEAKRLQQKIDGPFIKELIEKNQSLNRGPLSTS